MSQDRILWGAIAFSTVIYAVIAYTLSPVPQQPFETSARDTMTMALYGAALMTFVMAMIVPGMLRTSLPRLKMIVGLAMFEACAIFALVASMLHHDWRLYLPGWALAAIGFLRVFPSSE
ncbi:MAG TPA: hypothetical protein VHK90_13295, partial [Thermoanaerobaculia bacterium]|nr:hypothetical protein [Thermoanaerobaculia bacterium]